MLNNITNYLLKQGPNLLLLFTKTRLIIFLGFGTYAFVCNVLIFGYLSFFI